MLGYLGLAVICSSSNLVAGTYIVQKGDTLTKIAKELGFNSIQEAHFHVPSGNINKIYPGEMLSYKKKKHRKRFTQRNRIDLDKFCFKDSHSIHYRATERCK